MNSEIISNLTLPVIVVACLVVGYIIKNYVPLNNKHIPLLMALLGIALNYLINGYISFEETVVSGALSGILATGLHQAFSNYVNKSNDDQSDDSDE